MNMSVALVRTKKNLPENNINTTADLVVTVYFKVTGNTHLWPESTNSKKYQSIYRVPCWTWGSGGGGGGAGTFKRGTVPSTPLTASCPLHSLTLYVQWPYYYFLRYNTTALIQLLLSCKLFAKEPPFPLLGKKQVIRCSGNLHQILDMGEKQ